MRIEITLAYDRLDHIKLLFSEYVAMLGVDLSFQSYEAEFSALPGDYALPSGRLYVADYDNHLAGCIALKHYDGAYCEMKRLFVRPGFRGKHVGLALAEKVISDAKDMDYKALLLDTMGFLPASIALYRKLGFIEMAPYRYNPLVDAMFFKLEL